MRGCRAPGGLGLGVWRSPSVLVRSPSFCLQCAPSVPPFWSVRGLSEAPPEDANLGVKPHPIPNLIRPDLGCVSVCADRGDAPRLHQTEARR